MLRKVLLVCLATLGACSDGQGTARSRSDAPCPTSLEELAAKVFQPTCNDSGCHGSNDRAGGLDLETSALALELFGVEAALCTGEIRIVPGDSASSHLIAKLRGTAVCGAQMPVGSALSPETVDCVAAWIDRLDPSSACETCGGTACIDLETNAQHCGSCDRACGGNALCEGGECACLGDLFACDSGCVALQSDPANCGSCGADCGGLFCLQGECSADCGALTECSGACVDLLSDSRHCGACGDACGLGASCVNGQCQCGTATVSFSSDVQPIFSASCASTGCHDGVGGQARPGGPSGGGTSLDLTEGRAYRSLLETTTPCGPVVAPGDPSGSLLIGKLTGAELCSGSQMPKGDPALDSELIDAIAAWICQGAADN